MDTTYVTQVTDLVTNPGFIAWLSSVHPMLATLIASQAFQQVVITLLVALITFIVGKLQLSKRVVASVLHYGFIMLFAFFKTTKAELEKPELGNDLLHSMAVGFIDEQVNQSSNKTTLQKVGKFIGGTSKAVTYGYPIAKALLKSDFVKSLFKGK